MGAFHKQRNLHPIKFFVLLYKPLVLYSSLYLLVSFLCFCVPSNLPQSSINLCCSSIIFHVSLKLLSSTYLGFCYNLHSCMLLFALLWSSLLLLMYLCLSHRPPIFCNAIHQKPFPYLKISSPVPSGPSTIVSTLLCSLFATLWFFLKALNPLFTV